MSELDWSKEPCGCVWKEQYGDGSTSHLHLCELPGKWHGAEPGIEGGPFDHRCRCEATYSGNFRPECDASATSGGHRCYRIHWHSIRLRHKCHCGHEFGGGIFNRPLVVRRHET